MRLDLARTLRCNTLLAVRQMHVHVAVHGRLPVKDTTSIPGRGSGSGAVVERLAQVPEHNPGVESFFSSFRVQVES